MQSRPHIMRTRAALFQRGKEARGFTLLEIMIVLTIIVMTMAGVVSMFGQVANTKLKSQALTMSGALRLVYGRAAINGIRYQVVFDIDANTFRAECSEFNSAVIMDEDQSNFRDYRSRLRYDHGDEEADPFGLGAGSRSFDDCSEPVLDQQEMRNGITIDRVLTMHNEDVVDSGQVTIGFFPNGFVERSMIWLTHEDTGAFMTLSIDPMTGSVRVQAGDVEVPEDFFSVEED